MILENEDGEKTKYFFFESPDHPRTASFFSRCSLAHSRHLIEPAGMLRREQPLERFQKLCGDRKTSIPFRKKDAKSYSLEDMAERAKSLIEKRQAMEESGAVGAEAADVPMESETFQKINTLEDELDTVPAKAPAKRKAQRPAAPKAPKAQKSRGQKAPPPPVPANVPEHVSGDEAGAEDDDLARSIVAKIGGDAKAVRNLDVAKILKGFKLGRTLTGVPLPRFHFVAFVQLS